MNSALLETQWHTLGSRGVSVGSDCRFIGLSRESFGSEPYLITIGNHVTLTSGVRFLTHDGGVWVLRSMYPNIEVVGRVTIEDNVFVGVGAILLPDTTIGSNCVIAAGAVVRGRVPPDSVVGGVPARVISSIRDYEAKVVPRALHVRHQPIDDRRSSYLNHTEMRRSI